MGMAANALVETRIMPMFGIVPPHPVPAYKDTVRQTTQVAPSPAGLGAEGILRERRVEVE